MNFKRYGMFIQSEAAKYGITFEKVSGWNIYKLIYKGKEEYLFQGIQSTKSTNFGSAIARDKVFTRRFLKYLGVPVLPQIAVAKTDTLINFFEEHKPIVIKPRRGAKGENVFTNISDKSELLDSWDILKQKTNSYVAEKYFEGKNYRVLVINYNDVFVLERTPVIIYGDGKNTIRKLIEEENKKREGVLVPFNITITQDIVTTLKKKNMSLNTIPLKDELVQLTSIAGVSVGGGCSTDVDDFPEQIKKEALYIAQSLELGVCGIDCLVNDEGEYIFLEINSSPGLQMHHYPTHGKSQDPAKSFFSMLFNTNF